MTKEEVDKTCKEIGLKNYVVNDDMSVSCYSGVSLLNKKYTKLPVTFKEVHGSFNCGYGRLTTLEGCPQRVFGDFCCNSNQLRSLKGCPNKIGGGFYCADNQIQEIDVYPEMPDDEVFDCSRNPIRSLDGISGNFERLDISSTDIRNLPNVNNITFKRLSIHNTSIQSWLRVNAIDQKDYEFLSKLEEIIFILQDEGYNSKVLVRNSPLNRIEIITAIIPVGVGDKHYYANDSADDSFINMRDVVGASKFMEKNLDRINSIIESDVFEEFFDRLDDICNDLGLEVIESTERDLPRDYFLTNKLGGTQLAIMKMIKKKKPKSLNEKYSMPDSTKEVSDQIFDFVMGKVKMWREKNSKIIKTKFSSWMDDIMDSSAKYYKNTSNILPTSHPKDFPVNKVKFRLELQEGKWKFRGGAHVYTSSDSELRPKIHSNKMVDIGISLSLNIPEDKSEEDVAKDIRGVIYHEVLHCYQGYKQKLKGIDVIGQPISRFIIDIRTNICGKHYEQRRTWADFLKLVYLTASKEELDATMASTHTKSWHKYIIRMYREIYDDITKEELKKKLLLELSDKGLVEMINRSARVWNLKRYTSVDQFFDDMYQIPLKKREYVKRKLAKISTLNEGTLKNIIFGDKDPQTKSRWFKCKFKEDWMAKSHNEDKSGPDNLRGLYHSGPIDVEFYHVIIGDSKCPVFKLHIGDESTEYSGSAFHNNFNVINTKYGKY